MYMSGCQQSSPYKLTFRVARWYHNLSQFFYWVIYHIATTPSGIMLAKKWYLGKKPSYWSAILSRYCIQPRIGNTHLMT